MVDFSHNGREQHLLLAALLQFQTFPFLQTFEFPIEYNLYSMWVRHWVYNKEREYGSVTDYLWVFKLSLIFIDWHLLLAVLLSFQSAPGKYSDYAIEYMKGEGGRVIIYLG